MLILSHKSGVRCRLNIIFNRARRNQTCENYEQREMQNSQIGGDVEHSSQLPVGGPSVHPPGDTPSAGLKV